MDKLEWIKNAMHHQLMGMPVWTWCLTWFAGVMPALNEWINRSKYTTAQTLWQLGWRGLRATPLSKLPVLGDLIDKMSAPPMLRTLPGFPPPIPEDTTPVVPPPGGAK